MARHLTCRLGTIPEFRLNPDRAPSLFQRPRTAGRRSFEVRLQRFGGNYRNTAQAPEACSLAAGPLNPAQDRRGEHGQNRIAPNEETPLEQLGTNAAPKPGGRHHKRAEADRPDRENQSP